MIGSMQRGAQWQRPRCRPSSHVEITARLAVLDGLVLRLMKPHNSEPWRKHEHFYSTRIYESNLNCPSGIRSFGFGTECGDYVFRQESECVHKKSRILGFGE